MSDWQQALEQLEDDYMAGKIDYEDFQRLKAELLEYHHDQNLLGSNTEESSREIVDHDYQTTGDFFTREEEESDPSRHMDETLDKTEAFEQIEDTLKQPSKDRISLLNTMADSSPRHSYSR